MVCDKPYSIQLPSKCPMKLRILQSALPDKKVNLRKIFLTMTVATMKKKIASNGVDFYLYVLQTFVHSWEKCKTIDSD